jgi:sporulation protein YtfJ
MEIKAHKIEQIMKSAMSELKTIIDVNTVIGRPIKTDDGTTIIPITKVVAGFVAGGGEYAQGSLKNNKWEEHPFAGGSGSGFNIVPVGFLIKEDTGYKMVEVASSNSTNLFEVIAKVVNGLSTFINKKEKTEVNDEE